MTNEARPLDAAAHKAIGWIAGINDALKEIANGHPATPDACRAYINIGQRLIGELADALKASQAPLPDEIAAIDRRFRTLAACVEDGYKLDGDAAKLMEFCATLLRALKSRPVWDREKLLEWNESVVLACGFMDAVKPDAVKEGWWAPHDDNVRQRLSAFLQDFDAILAAQGQQTQKPIFSDVVLESAEAAYQRLKNQPKPPVSEWAESLAVDLTKAGEAEYGATPPAGEPEGREG